MSIKAAIASRDARRARIDLGGSAGVELRQLRAFVALADKGSMTAAARTLGLAQSTVSEALASLERALGTRAVTRRRGAHASDLTPAGRVLLPHARHILAALTDAQRAVASATREARGSVELIANESISTCLLPRALGRLRDSWPNTRFAVSVGSCPGVRAGLASGRFDLGLQLSAEVEDARAAAVRRGNGVVTVRLAEVPLSLFAGPGHPLLPRSPGSALPRGELAPYRVFLTDASGAFHALLRDFFRADGLPAPRLEATGTIESVKRSVLTSPLAVGVLPHYALVEDFRAGRLRPLAVRPPLPRVWLEALQPEAGPARPAASEVIDALRGVLHGSSS